MLFIEAVTEGFLNLDKKLLRYVSDYLRGLVTRGSISEGRN